MLPARTAPQGPDTPGEVQPHSAGVWQHLSSHILPGPSGKRWGFSLLLTTENRPIPLQRAWLGETGSESHMHENIPGFNCPLMLNLQVGHRPAHPE